MEERLLECVYKHCTFTYNVHVYTCIYLQPENSETLCSNIVRVAERDVPTLVQQASVVATKLTLYVSRHITKHGTWWLKSIPENVKYQPGENK